MKYIENLINKEVRSLEPTILPTAGLYSMFASRHRSVWSILKTWLTQKKDVWNQLSFTFGKFLEYFPSDMCYSLEVEIVSGFQNWFKFCQVMIVLIKTYTYIIIYIYIILDNCCFASFCLKNHLLKWLHERQF